MLLGASNTNGDAYGGVTERLKHGSCETTDGLWRQLAKLRQGVGPYPEPKGFD
jgi:hypothetical protein